MSREEEPPRRGRELKSIVVAIVIVLACIVAYIGVQYFRTAPVDAPASEPPGTTAPSFTEPPKSNTAE